MGKKKILVIDDDAGIRSLCRDALEREGYRLILASNGSEGVARLGEESFDLILLDIQMPCMDGFEVLSAIRKKDADVPVIVMTGFGTVENAVRALKSGASDFIVKPFKIWEFLKTVKNNMESGGGSREMSKLKMIETILELNRIIASLTSLDLLLDKVIAIVNNIFQPEEIAIYLAGEDNFLMRKHLPDDLSGRSFPVSYGSEEVAGIFADRRACAWESGAGKIRVLLSGKEKHLGFIDVRFHEKDAMSEAEVKFLELFAIQVGIGIENAMLFDAVKNSHLNSIRSLVNSLEAKDAYTKGHSEQVAYYSFLIGKQLGLSERELEILRNASYLHDLGKLGIRDSVLLKSGLLNSEEMDIIKRHPEMTVKILEPLGIRKEEMDACFYHHEKVNGQGYPAGLKGDAIPLYAKIISVADAYSAMISERPYRKGLVKEEAIAELKKWAGIQFDNKVVDVLVKILKESGEAKDK